VTDHQINAEAGRYEIKGGSSVELTVVRGAESWQFFAFVFAAAVTLALAAIDEMPKHQHAAVRVALKVVVFGVVGYLTLVNEWLRNRLVRLLNRFKREGPR
jgi:membrane associated rhomboid family serine protease